MAVSRRSGWIPFQYVCAFFGSLLIITPIFYTLSLSVRPSGEIFTLPPILIPYQFTLRSYIEMWKTFPVARYLLNSVILALGTTVLSIGIAALAGYGFARFRFRFQDQLMILLLIAQMFPGVATYVPLFEAFQRLHLYNTLEGLMILYTGFVTPFSVWMLYGYFKSIPRDIEEAALIDGCSVFEALRRVVLPLAIPGIGATAVLAMLAAWNEFIFAMLFLQDHNLWPITIGIANFQGEYYTAWGSMAAAAVVASLPPLIGFIVIQRQLIGGLLSGAVRA